MSELTLKANSKVTTQDRDARVLELYEQLIEIEQRLIPTGLHVFGRPSEAREKADLLRLIASFDRPEANTSSIVDLVTRALTSEAHGTETGDESLKERVDSVVATAIRRFVDGGTLEAERFLEREAKISPKLSHPIFQFLSDISEQLKTNQELDSLMRALRGEFIEPGPGADLVQNPAILPTGRNTHSINPYSVPSAASFTRSKLVAERLID
ncbi:MAG TPA: cobaltochelatase subunit CobN, partial [Pyrinomonadaceae bacterium]